MPDFLSSYMETHQTTVWLVIAVLVVGAWIVFKIIKRTIMMFLALFITIGVVGGAGAFYWWPN